MTTHLCPIHRKPMVADTFAGEGGATRGLLAAGYCVTAVDTDKNRLRYNPAQHRVTGDAVAFIVAHGWRYRWIWASPTCTGYSRGTVAIPDRVGKYDRLIAATREALETTGRPWVIENVEDAARLGEIRDPQLLCGRMFGLEADDADGHPLTLDRHRVFEATWDISAPPHPEHGAEQVAGVYGGSRRAKRLEGETLAQVAPRDRHAARYERGGGYVPRSKAVQERLLDITGMTMIGLKLSIPPAFALHIAASYDREHHAVDGWRTTLSAADHA